MKFKNSFNLIIAGVGGQGVMTLTHVLTALCAQSGILVHSSIHKGGAQQLGSIHSVLRMYFQDDPDAKNFSTQMLDGDLDLILGLEPWETLRYARYFSERTHVLSNSRSIGIETERYQSKKFMEPCEQLKSLKINLMLSDFSGEAELRFKSKKMLNFVVAERAIIDKLIPFKKMDLEREFESRGYRVQNIIEGDKHV